MTDRASSEVIQDHVWQLAIAFIDAALFLHSPNDRTTLGLTLLCLVCCRDVFPRRCIVVQSFLGSSPFGACLWSEVLQHPEAE